MALTVYNTLTRKKEQFVPRDKKEVGMYLCGPTVYWHQHIGNMRTYVLGDILRRVLEYNTYKVKHISNVTDVGHLTSDADDGEDKMEKAAVREGKNAQEIAQYYYDSFILDLKKMNILMPKKWTWATKHITEQIALVKTLEKKGFTYETSDGIYFDSSLFKDYGKLARLRVEGLQEGKRVARGEKKNKTDFALWKFSDKPGTRQQEWDSPWGVGFPGWHLECSAMSLKYLAAPIDFHLGGEDHIPIHHTNEIAQSEAATGKKFVSYWLHGAFLTFKGEKVSKSKGGLYTIPELETQGYSPLHLRYLYLLTHYRKQLAFSLDGLDAAKNAYERLQRKVIELRGQSHKGVDRTKEYKKQFLEAINDDLNMPRALRVVWSVLADFDFAPKKRLALLEEFDSVLGLGIAAMKQEEIVVPAAVEDLIRSREEARKRNQWEEADVLRQRIRDKGFVVEDGPNGVIVRAV